MSFLVSVSGRFSPVTLNNYEVERVSKVNSPEQLKNTSEGGFNTPKSKNDISIKKYQEALNIPKNFKQQIINARASELMTKKVVTIKSSSTLGDAGAILSKNTFRHIIIENDADFVCGIISEKDLLKNRENLNARVDNYMTSEVYFVLEHTSIQDIARLMFEKRISCTPVANESYRLVGIITQSDILKFIFNQQFIDNLSA